MTLDLIREKGVPLERQQFTWRELVPPPASKLDDDSFTFVRIVLMNGIESNALRTYHAMARMNEELRLPLANVRRVDQHQQTTVNWLLPADMSPLDTTIIFEQVAIEVTASIAEHEPDPYLAQMYRFGLLEDFDHLYRYSALMDRLTGKDANALTHGYTDIVPGRPTMVEHRMPEDNLRKFYDRTTAAPITKLNALTLVAGENQTHDYYMTVGPQFADPLARQLYAEIASIEEQHVTQYESMTDPHESMLQKWLMYEATEVYNYWSCVQWETNPRIKAIWERFLDYELGHLHYAMDIFQQMEHRDAAEVLPATLPEAIDYQSHREFVKQTLRNEVNLRARGTEVIDASQEKPDWPSVQYREQMNRDGSPSQEVATGYIWMPGTELAANSPTSIQQRRSAGQSNIRQERKAS